MIYHEAAFPEAVEDYLEQHNVLTLATNGEEGPWSSAVFFAHQGRSFYFISDPRTTHGRHIVESGKMAASIHEDYSAWQDIKGIQMRGKVWEITDRKQWKAGLRCYFRKYDFVEDFTRGEIPDAIGRRMKNIRLFCFEPELIMWLDNSTGFGNRIQVYPAPDKD